MSQTDHKLGLALSSLIAQITSNLPDADATYRRMYRQYWFPNMYKFVTNKCNICVRCDANRTFYQRVEEYHSYTPEESFDQWQIDIAGPFNPPTEPGGYQHILVATDVCTKRVWYEEL